MEAFARVRRHHVYVALASFFMLVVSLCLVVALLLGLAGLRVTNSNVTSGRVETYVSHRSARKARLRSPLPRKPQEEGINATRIRKV